MFHSFDIFSGSILIECFFMVFDLIMHIFRLFQFLLNVLKFFLQSCKIFSRVISCFDRKNILPTTPQVSTSQNHGTKISLNPSNMRTNRALIIIPCVIRVIKNTCHVFINELVKKTKLFKWIQMGSNSCILIQKAFPWLFLDKYFDLCFPETIQARCWK